MSRFTQPILINSGDLANFRAQLEREAERLANQAADELERILRRKYRNVLAAFGQSGVNPLPRPELSFERRIGRTRGGEIHFELTASVVEPSGKKSSLYYWLSFGTRSRTQTRTSPPIPERRRRATVANSLNVHGFGGFTGDFFRIAAGERVKGIEARNWDELIGRETEREVSGRDLAGLRWDIRYRVEK